MAADGRDKAHAAWVNRVGYEMEYAHGEVRSLMLSLKQELGESAYFDSYWKRTDYLFQQVTENLKAIYVSLEDEGEYVPPVAAEGK
jgi:hypothetical protein